MKTKISNLSKIRNTCISQLFTIIKWKWSGQSFKSDRKAWSRLLRISLFACITPDTTQFRRRRKEFPLNHFQKPHQRKQGNHISCRGNPGIPLVLFLLPRSHMTHCFNWQSFQRWVQSLLEPSFFFSCLSRCFSPLLLSFIRFTDTWCVTHKPSSTQLHQS